MGSVKFVTLLLQNKFNASYDHLISMNFSNSLSNKKILTEFENFGIVPSEELKKALMIDGSTEYDTDVARMFISLQKKLKYKQVNADITLHTKNVEIFCRNADFNTFKKEIEKVKDNKFI